MKSNVRTFRRRVDLHTSAKTPLCATANLRVVDLVELATTSKDLHQQPASEQCEASQDLPFRHAPHHQPTAPSSLFRSASLSDDSPISPWQQEHPSGPNPQPTPAQAPSPPPPARVLGQVAIFSIDFWPKACILTFTNNVTRSTHDARQASPTTVFDNSSAFPCLDLRLQRHTNRPFRVLCGHLRFPIAQRVQKPYAKPKLPRFVCGATTITTAGESQTNTSPQSRRPYPAQTSTAIDFCTTPLTKDPNLQPDAKLQTQQAIRLTLQHAARVSPRPKHTVQKSTASKRHQPHAIPAKPPPR